jgi:hypothetical protein
MNTVQNTNDTVEGTRSYAYAIKAVEDAAWRLVFEAELRVGTAEVRAASAETYAIEERAALPYIRHAFLESDIRAANAARALDAARQKVTDLRRAANAVRNLRLAAEEKANATWAAYTAARAEDT